MISIVLSILFTLIQTLSAASAQPNVDCSDFLNRGRLECIAASTNIRIDPSAISVSGVSSGAFMAHQFHVIHSSNIVGAGLVAAGPFNCSFNENGRPDIAEGVAKGLTVCSSFYQKFCAGNPACALSRYVPGALPTTYQGPKTEQEAAQMAAESVASTQRMAVIEQIDDPRGLIGDKVAIYHGKRDPLVPQAVTDAVANYYSMSGSIIDFQDNSLDVTHTMITDNYANLPIVDHIIECTKFDEPFVCDAHTFCGRGLQNSESCLHTADAAGKILATIYGKLAERQAPKFDWRIDTPQAQHGSQSCNRDPRCKWLLTHLLPFNQGSYIAPDAGKESRMGHRGYIFIPSSGCTRQHGCRLHIAFHGCVQGQGTMPGKYGPWPSFVENAGYNEWADQNDIVVLYPLISAQTLTALSEANAYGCWPFWVHSANDVTYDGQQVSAVARMVNAMIAQELLPTASQAR